MSALANDIRRHWASIYPLLSIRNEEEYAQAVERLDNLLDEIGTNEQHPLYGLQVVCTQNMSHSMNTRYGFSLPRE